MATQDESRRRDLLRSSLDLVVLSVLADGEHYGYLLQKRIREASGQTITAGTLYPLLHSMEADGLIAARWDEGAARPRKWYELTGAGRLRLRQEGAAWQAIIARLESVILPALRTVASAR